MPGDNKGINNRNVPNKSSHHTSYGSIKLISSGDVNLMKQEIYDFFLTEYTPAIPRCRVQKWPQPGNR